MPVQKFAPMTKEFPSFDCDAHVTEPPWLWERAKDYLSKDEFEALKMAREGLLVTLRMALEEARIEGERVRQEDVRIKTDSGVRSVNSK
jgi:hypothetical protein